MKRILILVCAITWFADIALTQTNGATAAKPIFIHCGTLIDGKSEQPRKNVFFEIEGDKIAAIPAAVSGSAKLIDLSNETCLPGLIDTHTHILLNGDITAADYDDQLLKQSPEYRTILACLLYTSPSPRDLSTSRMPSSA